VKIKKNFPFSIKGFITWFC